MLSNFTSPLLPSEARGVNEPWGRGLGLDAASVLGSWSAGQFHDSELSMCLHCCSGPRRSISGDHPHFPGYRRSWVRLAEELVFLGNKTLFLVQTMWWLFLKRVEFLLGE